MYIERADWDKQLNEFNIFMIHLAKQNFRIDENQAKFMLIRSIPECLSVIPTVVSSQQELIIECLDVLIWAEIDRKKNPHNPQGKQCISSTNLLLPKPHLVRSSGNVWKNNNNKMNPIGKKGKCHWYKKPVRFKGECRKYQAFWKQKLTKSQLSKWSVN